MDVRGHQQRRRRRAVAAETVDAEGVCEEVAELACRLRTLRHELTALRQRAALGLADSDEVERSRAVRLAINVHDAALHHVCVLRVEPVETADVA